jgi:hypothetical protein
MISLGSGAIKSLEGNFYQTQSPRLSHPTFIRVRGPSFVLYGESGELRTSYWLDCDIFDCVEERFGTEWVGIRRSLPFDEVSQYQQVQEPTLPWNNFNRFGQRIRLV